MTFKLLPNFFSLFLHNKEQILNLICDSDTHKWDRFPTKKFITTTGIEWFAAKNIGIRDTVSIFNAPKNLNGTIHSDDPLTFAFNFVLYGTGKMQWTEDDGQTFINTKKLDSGIVSSYKIKTNVKNVTIVEEWDDKIGNMALVNINKFHRIITTSETRRICLSLRTDEKMTFEEIAVLI